MITGINQATLSGIKVKERIFYVNLTYIAEETNVHYDYLRAIDSVGESIRKCTLETKDETMYVKISSEENHVESKCEIKAATVQIDMEDIKKIEVQLSLLGDEETLVKLYRMLCRECDVDLMSTQMELL
jgi:hypothetical protein